MTSSASGARARSAPSGVVVLDKPSGPTSHDVVRHVRRTLKTREVGHAGTLDPMATGVLVVAVGEATKLVPWLTASEKSYEAVIALGVETDTLDAQGREVLRSPPSDALRAALRAFAGRGEIVPPLSTALVAERARTGQVPPAFSAVHVDGERAHARARRGQRVDLPMRPVAVSRLDLLECHEEPPSVRVALDVSKGYYVRALARDFTAALGTGGHLTSLRRVRAGPFGCEEAVPGDAPSDVLLAALEPLDRAAGRLLPVSTLTDAGVRDARSGRVVRPADIEAAADSPSAWLDGSGRLVAIGRMADGVGRVLRGFSEPAPRSDPS